MKFAYLAALGAAVAAISTNSAMAQSPSPGKVAVGALAGSNGLGVELKASVNSNIVIRGSVEGFGISRDVNYEDIDYSGKLQLFTGGAFVDLHPSGSPLFISGGAYVGKRRINISATPTTTVEIGDATYTPAQVGSLNGSVKMSKFTPFAGLGFDSTFTSSSNWGFKFIAGVAFSKRPEVALTSTGGTLSSDAAFQAQLATERDRISDDAKAFKYYPVVSVGVSRRF